jgi:hypothetical protein
VTLAVIIEPLSSAHDRSSFACGAPALDRYLREQSSQDVRRRFGNCFVAIEQAEGAIAGYYTLAASSIAFAELPTAVGREELPSH